jgi:gluconolactonase
MRMILYHFVILLLVSACTSGTDPVQLGSFHASSDAFWEVVPRGAVAHRIGIDFQFTEGPAILKDGSLIFSDIPSNTIYRWNGKQYEIFRKPSRNSNGLLVAPDGSVLACEHGSRMVTRTSETGKRDTLAFAYHGLRLNSPNDLCMTSDGIIFFTDPPWGLEGRNEDPLKEIPFNGVFRVSGDRIDVVDSTLSWPNGIALSPDERFLYVANFEEARPGEGKGMEVFWVRYSLGADGKITGRDIFYRAEDPGRPGGPDGMKTDRDGNLFMTGPGGILVVDPEGVLLGTIELPEVPSNLAFGPGEKDLYVTAGSMIIRIPLHE